MCKYEAPCLQGRNNLYALCPRHKDSFLKRILGDLVTSERGLDGQGNHPTGFFPVRELYSIYSYIILHTHGERERDIYIYNFAHTHKLPKHYVTFMGIRPILFSEFPPSSWTSPAGLLGTCTSVSCCRPKSWAPSFASWSALEILVISGDDGSTSKTWCRRVVKLLNSISA